MLVIPIFLLFEFEEFLIYLYTCILCMCMKWDATDIGFNPRWGHSLTALNLDPGLTVATVFGGSDKPMTGSDETQPKLADTTLLHFCECISKTKLCTSP